MTNQLIIKRGYWPDVTEMPHFIVSLVYEGCTMTHDDLYFDDIDNVVAKLEALERKRKGKVLVDGGETFIISVEATSTGGINLKFKTTSAEPIFPGKLSLEGYFEVDGEYASNNIRSLIKLFQDGKEYSI